MGVPLYVSSYFSLAAVKILYFIFNSNMPWCESLSFHLICNSLCFLDLVMIFFPVLGKFSTIISSNIFSGPFFFSSSSETRIVQMLVHLMVYQRSLRVSSFLLIIFSLFCSMADISTILYSRSLMCSSSSVLLLLILYFLFQ